MFRIISVSVLWVSLIVVEQQWANAEWFVGYTNSKYSFVWSTTNSSSKKCHYGESERNYSRETYYKMQVYCSTVLMKRSWTFLF